MLVPFVLVTETLRVSVFEVLVAVVKLITILLLL
jgi:hypothetical protein